MRELKVFDASSYLTSDEIIEEFLIACLEDPDPTVYLRGVKEVEKALAARLCTHDSRETDDGVV